MVPLRFPLVLACSTADPASTGAAHLSDSIVISKTCEITQEAKINVCEHVIPVNNFPVGRLSEGEVFFPFFLWLFALIIDRTTLI